MATVCGSNIPKYTGKMTVEATFVAIGATLLASIVASKLAFRLGVPVLLLFLAIGMLIGSDGPGGIWFSDARLAQNLGVVALAFILFSGGMDLDWKPSKPYMAKSLVLATVGVATTALVVGAVAHEFLGFRWLEGLLLGSIIASTDAAAVFSTLARNGGQLREDVRRTLEIESGSNDPTAIFLTIAFVGALKGSPVDVPGVIGGFASQMLLGVLGGWLVGRGGVLLMRSLKLDAEGLYHAVSLSVVLMSFGFTALIGGNGFLAVYVAGIAFGNGEFRQRKGLRRFHDGIAWLMQIVLFVGLGLLVFPSQLPEVALAGIVVSAALMFVARPIGVVLSLLPFRVPWREQTLIAWSGLRGAVPIVLATYPLLEGVPRAQEYFNLVFFVVLFSALAQGTTIPLFAQRLGLVRTPSTEP